MKPSSAIFWVLLSGVMAFGLFQLKGAVQAREAELAALNRELLASKEAVQVLRAEWSYLSRPDRIAALAARHLDLAPMTPDQVGALNMLPLAVAHEVGQ